jgi:hypothetical protein
MYSGSRRCSQDPSEQPFLKVLRLHALSGFGKPSVYKIDVLSNHSWQISFELEAGGIVRLCRLAPHKRIDGDPRA